LGPRISITALIFWLLFDQAKSNKRVPTAMALKYNKFLIGVHALDIVELLQMRVALW
jgi:hypothetical protein